jgi:hypothetical protein
MLGGLKNFFEFISCEIQMQNVLLFRNNKLILHILQCSNKAISIYIIFKIS